MKNKNPLYVVKGKEVLEAKGVLDLLIKKFNLEPLVLFLSNLMKLLLEQIQNYPTFLVVKSKMDELLATLVALKTKFA
ncbi:MAG: hypothetical protein AB7I27_18455 [Bacteriovoracaceae bacterium]